MRIKKLIAVLPALVVLATGPIQAEECDGVEASVGADLVNRYVWRGIDFGNAPSLQPSLAFSYCNFEMGFWGAYTLSNQASENDEIDTWIGYSLPLNNGMTLSAGVTDYYFPNAGIKWGNWNDHDATRTVIDGEDTTLVSDAGAHTIEVGLSVSGPESVPVTVSGYVNVYNDAGNNAYFQIDYSTVVGETSMSCWIGGTPGSEENPGYYGTDDLQLINIGIGAAKELVISESLSLPVWVAFSGNPNAEMAYLTFGLSL